jgi:twitching motility protein PilT
MINVNDIIKDAVQRKASDIHFISGLKPMLRINRDLLSVENADIISDDDMWDIYDFFLSGNVDRDKLFREKKVLDCSTEVGDVRLRINVSYSNSVPVITTRIIRNSLPRYEDLGVPDIVRRMTEQSQGLILVTGKTNSGKSTTLNALINYINETQNRKILTLESPVEYRHKSKKSIIIQKEVGVGGDVPTYSIGTKNSLREDCDILVIGEIRDKETMDAAIETAESGHLVIGTLHTKSCAETIDRMINFYEVRDQSTIKYMIASILKLVISQRLIKNKRGTLTLIPEVMVVDNVIAGIIRKDKLSVSEIEDAIQSSSGNGNIGLINSLAELFVKDEITLDQAKAQIEEKNVEILNRTIMQLKIKKQEESNQKSNNAYGMY